MLVYAKRLIGSPVAVYPPSSFGFLRFYSVRPQNYNYTNLCRLADSYNPRHIIVRSRPAEKLRAIAVPFFNHLSDLLHRPTETNSRKFNGFVAYLRSTFIQPSGILNCEQLGSLTQSLRERGIAVCKLEYIGALVCIEFVKILETISYDYEKVDTELVYALKVFKKWSETNRDEVKKGINHYKFLVRCRKRLASQKHEREIFKNRSKTLF